MHAYRCVAWATALALAMEAPPCRADGRLGVGAGVTDSIDGESTGVLTASWLGAARHPWEISAGYLGRRRDAVDGPAPVTVFVAASKRLVWRGWFVSGGIALIDRDSDILSGHGQFYTGAGYSTGAWTLSLRHISNGDTGGRNRGETFALLEYRF
ncbi:MAG TPA: acyloxyacyl hydrolase [Lysobacter sp.]